MKRFSCKVLPIFRNKNKKTCCICLEIKKDCVSCNNPKCNDGIICLKCLGKMKDSQRNQCQICRVEMDVFKTRQVQVKPVENITNCRNKIKCFKRGETRPTCCKTIKEGICLLFMIILFLTVGRSSCYVEKDYYKHELQQMAGNQVDTRSNSGLSFLRTYG